MSFEEFRKRYLPKKAWIPAVFVLSRAALFHHSALPGAFMTACLWLAFWIAWRARKEQFPITWSLDDLPDWFQTLRGWWRKFRFCGIYYIDEFGWYVVKTAWVPVVVLAIIGAIVNGLLGILAGLMIGTPWLVVYTWHYQAWFQETNDKYPLTPHEAQLLAGWTNIHDAAIIGGWGEYWRLICMASMGGPITFDAAGNIIPSRYGFDPLRAKQGLPQVTGKVIATNDYLLRNGPMFDNAWITYNTRYGNGRVERPKHYGIAPQPSIPK